MESGARARRGAVGLGAVGSTVDPEASEFAWLLNIFSDLRAQIFGGP